MPYTLFAAFAISFALNDGLAAPSFSFHAIVSLPPVEENVTISRSPSLSISAR